MISLNELQLRWLYAHGGRTEADVRDSKDGKYVLMNLARGGQERIFIPTDEEIKDYFNDTD